ncbi:peptide-N4-(N-acetyl-beta-glucosaminyl)asparagine amidase A-like [Primulina eburnea]|uniref:peptide-N4-(N-acetyl-beta- glucosaminyl)asparagine amidase A-like n=1 Tax=Primulina eburnea TaxID=1245227 RepID=UPI003C6C9A9E
MPSPVPILLLFTLFLRLSAATAADSHPTPPPHHHSRFSKQRLRLQNGTTKPQEHFEITRPLPFNSLTPSCTLPIFSGEFGNTIGLPPSNSTYYPPVNCPWSNAVLHLSAASSGDQYDRIAAVWLSGSEILRTSTAEPTDNGVFWNVRKDVTKYSFLLRQSNLTLAVMLENIVNDVFTGVYQVNLTFLYYDINCNDASIPCANVPLSLFPPIQRSTPLSLNYSISSLDLNESPADLIIPISSTGDEGFWFRIESESDVQHQSISIPLNTYRAVIEVYCSFHGNDEFWYSNPPDSYIDINGLGTKRGHGTYREVVVTLDDNVVGSAIPFPVIFTGGINPLFWEPVVSIGAFDLPSYEIELTPFLGLLLDGKTHDFGFSVTDGISFWLVDANLHLWVDENVDKVQARPVRLVNPSSCIEREFTFHELDGKFEVEGERSSEFSGWVNSSAGNFTTYVSTKLEFENTIEFRNSGKTKRVKQEVEVENVVKIQSDTRVRVLSSRLERKYPLSITSSTEPGSTNDIYTLTTRLEHSITEKKSNGRLKNTLVNSQKSDGWMVVQDHDVLFGSAKLDQSYSVRGGSGCYSRTVLVADGSVIDDTTNIFCASSL